MTRGERWLRRLSGVCLLLTWGYLALPATAQVRVQRGWTTVSQFLLWDSATTSGVRVALEAGRLAIREGDDSVYGEVHGGLVMPVTRVTTNYSLLPSDMAIASGSFTGPFTLTLPATTALGKMYLIQDWAGLAAGGSNRTITLSGLVNGGSNTTITTAFGAVRLLGGLSSTSGFAWFTF